MVDYDKIILDVICYSGTGLTLLSYCFRTIKLRIIRKIEESRTKGVSIPQHPFTYRDLDPTKITCKTN